MHSTLQSHRIVAVFDDADHLETRRLRICRANDQIETAIWRGLAYPLLKGDRINIAGEAKLPGTEQTIQASATQPTMPGFSIVDGDETAYVLLAGSVAERENVATALRELGCGVLRVGRYLGEPHDGLAPDWFIRFTKQSASVERLIQRIQEVASVTPVESDVSVGAALRLRLLVAELANARSHSASLAAEVARLRVERARSLSSAATESEEALRALEDETAGLLAALEEETRLRAEAEARAEEAAKLARPVAARGVEAEVASVVDCLLPHIHFLRDSLSVAAIEYRDRRALYRALAQMREDGARLPNTWKKLRGLDRWWERHVSDGTDDQGRIYARFNDYDRSFDTLVSHKGEQARDLNWLRNR